ncbi:MAG: hypothetical protein F6K55_06270 [Moorea sp. SIO4A3]|nr:hypothetical protein [Moorena sp. SIO4A3]
MPVLLTKSFHNKQETGKMPVLLTKSFHNKQETGKMPVLHKMPIPRATANA